MDDDSTFAAPHGARVADTPSLAWDTAYEWRAVLLLSLGFALVGFDRYLIFPMFPVTWRT